MPNSPADIRRVARPCRFDGESYCVVHLRPNSDVVQMTSNIADAEVATDYANMIRRNGGHVFKVVPANVLVAALQFVKKDYEVALNPKGD